VGPGEDFDAGYRSREDFERWIVHDPLICDIDTLSKVEGGVIEAIDSAITFAEESSWPGPAQLLTDVI
jgi:TPP-dependent pyruvate/acetoin dehydrogenase alpha subunit